MDFFFDFFDGFFRDYSTGMWIGVLFFRFQTGVRQSAVSKLQSRWEKWTLHCRDQTPQPYTGELCTGMEKKTKKNSKKSIGAFRHSSVRQKNWLDEIENGKHFMTRLPRNVLRWFFPENQMNRQNRKNLPIFFDFWKSKKKLKNSKKKLDLDVFWSLNHAVFL